MVILLQGAATELGEAIAACARDARGYRTVSSADAAGCGAVIHCAGPDAALDPALVRDTIARLEGTGKPFVYTSTAWLFGATRGRLAGEAFPLRPPPEFAWLPAVERELFDTTVRGLRGIVIRPAVTYGGAAGIVERLAAGAVPLSPQAAASQHSFVHLKDLAELCVLACESAPAGSLYVAADGPAVPWGNLAQRLGPGVRTASLEAARAETGPLADWMVLDQRIGSTRAGRELGWRPACPTVMAAAHS
ncbi:MAG: hypothetical protein IT162_03235 [Bryobacterales bacterium]|nr:hypothetical protein [Bryobacterales bacterium]